VDYEGLGVAFMPLAKLRDLAQQGPITLVFAAHDTEHNNAIVLRDLLPGLKRVRLS